MSNIVSYLNSISSEVSNQNQTIKSRVAKVNQSWEGDAQEGFNDAHQEAIICAEKLESKIKDMKRIAQNLESSIRAADRDKASKKNK